MKYLFLLFISVMSVITPFAQNNSNTSLPYDSLNDINWYKKSVATLLEKVETLADNEEKVLIYLNIISKYVKKYS